MPQLSDTNPWGVGTSQQTRYLYGTWVPKMAEAGVKWVRDTVAQWGTVEPTNNAWSWSWTDSYLSTIKANNMYASGFLSPGVGWLTSTAPTGFANGAAELAEFAQYVTAVVGRYKGDIAYWELGNETQLISGMTPEYYAALLVTAYDAAKAADPEARIGISLASVDVDYIKRMIKAGAADHFDFLIVHPYELAGTLNDGQEPLYMHMVPTIRQMLADVNPAKVNVPIWITEVGEAATPGNLPELANQAQALWKIYTMGIAQGVAVVDWFEAYESDYHLGLLTSTGAKNPAWFALDNLTAQLGDHPVYKGWVLLNGTDYGFVFQGASTTVMAAWAPPGSTHTVSFGQSVQVMGVNASTGAISTTTVSSYSLTNSAVLVIGVPASLVTQAQANLPFPLPWNGDHTNDASVSVTMGASNTELGLHQFYADSRSTATTFLGASARYAGVAAGQTFTVDPNFLAYTHAAIKITAVVSRGRQRQCRIQPQVRVRQQRRQRGQRASFREHRLEHHSHVQRPVAHAYLDHFQR